MPPLPAWLTMATINPCFSIVGKSAGPSSSTDLSPMRLAFAASSSTDMSLKHHRQTDCLIALFGLAGCVPVLRAPGALIAPPAVPPVAPLDAQAADTPTAPRPASAPLTSALRRMKSRRVGMAVFRLEVDEDNTGRAWATATRLRSSWHQQPRLAIRTDDLLGRGSHPERRA
jgi:hypothetical protein